jgi:hypothetical protein
MKRREKASNNDFLILFCKFFGHFYKKLFIVQYKKEKDATTLNIMTYSIMTFGLMTLHIIVRKRNIQHKFDTKFCYAKCCYGESRILLLLH